MTKDNGGKGKKDKKDKKDKDSTLGKILRLFKNSSETSGELTVSGADSLSFDVRGKNSKKVKVHFADLDPTNAPCNPGAGDTLSYVLIPKKGPESTLKVSWSVSGVRTIVWNTDNKD